MRSVSPLRWEKGSLGRLLTADAAPLRHHGAGPCRCPARAHAASCLGMGGKIRASCIATLPSSRNTLGTGRTFFVTSPVSKRSTGILTARSNSSTACRQLAARRLGLPRCPADPPPRGGRSRVAGPGASPVRRERRFSGERESRETGNVTSWVVRCTNRSAMLTSRTGTTGRAQIPRRRACGSGGTWWSSRGGGALSLPRADDRVSPLKPGIEKANENQTGGSK